MQGKRNYNLILGAAITAVMLSLILSGLIRTPHDPNKINAGNSLSAPSAQYLLGTDNFGRDILSRVIIGAGSTLYVAAATVAIGALAGMLIGGLTGYFGGWVDELFMRAGDIILAFPSILLALVLISLIGPGRNNIIIALGIMFIPSFARVVRGEYVRCRELDYVHSARIIGTGNMRIMFVHILPNAAPVILRAIAIGFNNAVLAEASMSYLGLGVQPPDASLGRMLSESQSYLFSAPWYALSAGIAIVLLILGFSLLGEGIGARDNA
ncbi:MAG: ABC transporter permease [Oscillospiraceae bacterium]|nr:ABC transporter permease [Oscillospiraceae bacterium]